MQELQLMRNDMKEMRGNITNLFMENRDQSNIREHTTSHTQWGYGNFSPQGGTFEHNSYDCYKCNRLGARNGYNDTYCKRVPRNELGSKNMSNENSDSYSYGKYNCRRCSQTLGTTSKLFNYNNSKLPLLCGTFGSYDYVAWEQEVESLFYSYGVREKRSFNWFVMKKVLRNRFGVGNHAGQRQGQAKEKFMESSVGEKTTKVDELSQVQDRRTTHHEKKTLVPL
ncbi:hypothetical protein M9H77_08374 [Catharanthus roseus]|uniref:Uncharacterized protein n=1 Tax=Catharanthus roseus TaxID=4058 RepID=A0ACC0BXR6_CATRO|nr:hypothetical protein M9H77_08374 [Catharanthus roseus]